MAAKVGGRLEGPDRAIRGVAPVEEATADDLVYLDRGDRGEAGVVLVRETIGGTCVVVADPLAALVRILADVQVPNAPPEVHPSVVLHPGVVVSAGCSVGEGTELFPNVVLYPGTRVGRRCRIHAGTVIGADGFRYHPTRGGLLKVPQLGGVTIGDDVELGAACTIDRGFLSDTTLGDGCKLDDQVHVGHNCRLGRGVVIAAQTGLSGSCRVGDHVQIGGQVGVADHAVIGDGARIGAQSGVHGAIPPGETWLGTPAMPIATTRRVYALMKDLPAMWREWVRPRGRGR